MSDTNAKPAITIHTSRQTLGLYWARMRPYRWLVISQLFAITAGVLLQNILVPWQLAQGLKVLPGFAAQPSADFWAVFGSILLIYCLAQLGQWLSWRLSAFVGTRLSARVIRDLDQSVFRHLSSLSYKFYANTFAGSLVAQSNRFVGSFERLYDTLVYNVLPLLLRVAAAFIVILFFAPWVALGLLVFSVVYTATAGYLFHRKAALSRRAAAARTKLTARLADNLTNIAAVKYFAREDDEIKGFQKLSQRHYGLLRRDWDFGEAILAWQALLMTVFETVVFYVSLKLVASHTIDFSQLVLIQAYVWSVFGSLWGVGGIVRNVERSLADAAEMTELMGQEAEVQDSPKAKPVTVNQGEVQLKDVTFAYHDDGRRHGVFESLNLKVKPGERIGLVGPSGGGKTTITKLLLRLMDIEKGQILLDGYDVATMRQADVRRAISYVPQEPLLFHRSLRENIAYGMPDATEAQIVDAARKAHATEFIDRLPHGYDTMVGERGIKLSGGQRQRIAIARAMLKDAPILILDEATSALDSESERLIQDALWELMKGRTALVIAHRLSTIQRLDQVAVLANGAVIEQGTHASLLAQNGAYARLWSHQSGGFIED
jgi:ATP-binding cassette subfamily B protein